MDKISNLKGSHLTNRIQLDLLKWAKVAGYDIVIPNYYYDNYEMDLMSIKQSGFVYEYEVKISLSDYKADFKKGNKHFDTRDGKRANRFYFVVPEDLIQTVDVPNYCGLIYYRNGLFNLKKNAPLLHKNKFINYKSLCHSLAFREQIHRGKSRMLKFQYDNLIRDYNNIKNG